MADLLSAGCTLSTQILAESANVMRRKLRCSIAEIEDFHDTLLSASKLHRIEPETVRRSLRIADRYGFSIYDCLVVATALEAGCSTLYSEDLQHGQSIENRLKVLNPFIAVAG